jgi:hypothetical protein
MLPVRSPLPFGALALALAFPFNRRKEKKRKGALGLDCLFDLSDCLRLPLGVFHSSRSGHVDA